MRQVKHIDATISRFSTRKTNRATAIVSMMNGTILLIMSIVTVYLVTNRNGRLVLICGFTVAFVLSVHLTTIARKAELFASTAV